LDDARSAISPYIETGCSNVARDIYWMTTIELMADTVADLGWAEAAVMLLPLLQPYVDQWDSFSPSSNGPVARPVGRLSAIVSGKEESEAYFEQALAISDAMASPLHAAHTYLDWGRVLIAQPDRADVERASGRLLRAEELAVEHGLTLVQRLAREGRQTIDG